MRLVRRQIRSGGQPAPPRLAPQAACLESARNRRIAEESVDGATGRRGLEHLLVGCRLPRVELSTHRETRVCLPRDAHGGIVLYLHPGLREAHAAAFDAAEHVAFDRVGNELKRRRFTAVGVSSQTSKEQFRRVAELRIGHELWSDPELILARELGLPTFENEGEKKYERLTLMVLAGVIQKAFYPVDSPHQAAFQALTWLKATARTDRPAAS
jgi:peroxiredoxin